MARKEHKYHYLYKITNTKNGRYYLGIHSTSNLEDGYLGGGKRIKNSVKKHGKEFHIKEILEFFESREKLVEKEKELVDHELLKDPMCMNIKLGGEGWCCTGIQIGGDKWKKANERWKSEEGKKYLSEKIKNKWTEEKYSERVKEGLKKHWEENLGAFSGKKHSTESKEKMSKSRRGKKMGEENSQYGKCWFYNDLLGLNKRIKKDEIEKYISEGWHKGMKFEYFNKK